MKVSPAQRIQLRPVLFANRASEIKYDHPATAITMTTTPSATATESASLAKRAEPMNAQKPRSQTKKLRCRNFRCRRSSVRGPDAIKKYIATGEPKSISRIGQCQTLSEPTETPSFSY